MKALLERTKVAVVVALTACCLAFSAAADDGDGTDGAQAQSTTSSQCKAFCKADYDVCTSGGGSFSECNSTYDACTDSCDQDDD